MYNEYVVDDESFYSKTGYGNLFFVKIFIWLKYSHIQLDLQLNTKAKWSDLEQAKADWNPLPNAIESSTPKICLCAAHLSQKRRPVTTQKSTHQKYQLQNFSQNLHVMMSVM